jgi:hypothetical protein
MKSYGSPPQMALQPGKKYTASIETSAGTMTLNCSPTKRPRRSTTSFFLAREGFYNGVIFPPRDFAAS